MAKCFVGIDKIKSMGTLKARWNHDINEDFRKEHVDNADSELYEDNDILQMCLDENGNTTSYDKAVKDRIKNLKQADGRKIKNDAVLAYDIVLEFGDADDIEEEGIDVDEWERRSLEWLKETFNVAGDNKNNVISVVCHKDESSPHIHAIVTPVDERGCLCARSFTNGSSALSHFQDTYAKKLEDLGIERGVRGSSAHHKSNRQYNAEKKKAATLPEPLPNESAIDYLAKYQMELEARAVVQKEKMDKLERNLRARNDEERFIQRQEINKELDMMKTHYEEIRNDSISEIEELNNIILDLQSQNENLKKENSVLSNSIYDIESMKIGYDEYNFQQKALEHLSKVDIEKANELIRLQNLAETTYQDYLDSQASEIELNDTDIEEML